MNAPATESELMLRCASITGKSLEDIANQCHQTVPDNLLRRKGWVGQLIEQALGADASTKAEPDFTKLGIELKTLPLDHRLKPKESTFICTVPNPIALDFEDSLLWKKLRHVLWLPIEAANNLPISQRRIGQAILWQPNKQQKAILQQDWEELAELLSLGHYAQVTARHGTYLQCRPKAASNKITQRQINNHGEEEWIVPRGFYLRPIFTQQILP